MYKQRDAVCFFWSHLNWIMYRENLFCYILRAKLLKVLWEWAFEMTLLKRKWSCKASHQSYICFHLKSYRKQLLAWKKKKCNFLNAKAVTGHLSVIWDSVLLCMELHRLKWSKCYSLEKFIYNFSYPTCCPFKRIKFSRLKYRSFRKLVETSYICYQKRKRHSTNKKDQTM